MPQARVTGKNGKSAKWQRRSREIVDASAKVFAERGYHAISTTELCEANGIGKGALYYYIGSKEQLLAAIHDRVMDEVMLGADRVSLAGGTPPERLALLGEELLDVIFRFPDHVWVFLHDFPALTGKNAETFRQRRRAYEQRVEAVFRDGVESGDFRPLDTRLAVAAWLGMHNYTYLGLRAGGRFSVKEVAKSFADIFVWGIATRGLDLTANPRAASGVRYPVRA
jgi:AcrR family transcriptional regulator